MTYWNEHEKTEMTIDQAMLRGRQERSQAFREFMKWALPRRSK